MATDGPALLRIGYKVFPCDKSDPMSLGRTEQWAPILPVKLIIGHSQSRSFEAVVDSGSDVCLFHSAVGEAHGLKLDAGVEGSLGGVIQGQVRKVYYHKVKLIVAGSVISITAGFSPDLAVAGLLGRFGFFEHFNVVFDPTNNPPGLELTRIHRT
jgi:hypothetical protein